MNFSKLSKAQLQKFVNFDYPVGPNPNLNLIDQANNLFNQIKDMPNIIFPLPIIDLYLAFNYSGEIDQTYTIAQILNLSDDEIYMFDGAFNFNADLNNSEINRQRIFRILDDLNLIVLPEISQENIPEAVQKYLEPSFLQNLCLQSSFSDLRNFQISFGLNNLNCQIPITDPDGQIPFLNGVNHITEKAYNYIQDYGSNGALLKAIEDNNINLVWILIKSGADINSETSVDVLEEFREEIYEVEGYEDVIVSGEGERTPLEEAIYKNRLNIAKLLIIYGADVKDSLLQLAIYENLPNFVELFVDNVDIEFKNEFGQTALMIAASFNKFEIVKILIQRGANLNAQSNDGNTALHYASSYGYPNIVKLLLESEADLNIVNNDKRTALIGAALGGHYQIVVLLVGAGADVNHQDKHGETALFLAAINENLDIVKFLLENGANPNVKDNLGLSILQNLQMHGGDGETIKILRRYGARLR